MRLRLCCGALLVALTGCSDRVILDEQGLVLDTEGTGSESTDTAQTESDSFDDTSGGPTSDTAGTGCVPGQPECPCPPGQVPVGGQCTDAAVNGLEVFSAAEQEALAGGQVDEAPTVRVSSNGEPVAGVAVRFSTAGLAGGVVGTTDAVTDANGLASAGGWTLGKLDGTYFVRAFLPGETQLGNVDFVANTISDFDIVLHFVNPPTEAQVDAFEFSRLRWQAALINAHPAIQGTLTELSQECGEQVSGGPVSITGVHILVRLEEIDGPGGDNGNILGQAGPCSLRDDGSPYLGVMTFDTFDLDELQASGSLETVILHEMGHVLGVGSLWRFSGLLGNPSIPDNAGADTFFSGARATEVFEQLLGFQDYPGAIVPVENNAQPGSSDSHWRETITDDELMSPRLGGPGEVAPMSMLTIGSMGDLGYYVPNELAADPWALPPLGLVGPSDEANASVGHDEVLRPRWIRNQDGELVSLP